MILHLAFAFLGLPIHVVAGGLVVAHADDGDVVQGGVALPVAAFIKPVPVGLAAGGRDGAGAAELGKRGLAADAFGIVAGDDGQGRGGHRAGAVDVKQRAGVLLQDESHVLLQQVRLLLEGLPCLARGLQRNEHALFHHVPARTAYGEPAHPDRGAQPAVAFPDVFRGGGRQSRRGVGQRGHRRDQLRTFRVQGA